MKILLIILLSAFTTTTLLAHGGGTVRSGIFKGCHTKRATGEFHCHSKSRFNGIKWKSKQDAFKQLNSNAPTKKNKQKYIGYDRSSWPHWIDSDSDCQNLRAELLIAQSLTKVDLNKKGCVVVSGKWKDFYYPEILTRANKIDIDHVVPLKHAHDSGGMYWTRSQKQRFANDVENIVITNLKYNRSKGSKTILEWMPVNKIYACRYVKKWMHIKRKYKLNISSKELDYANSMGCK